MSVRVDVPNMIIITPAVLSKSSTGCLDRSIPFEERWLMKKGQGRSNRHKFPFMHCIHVVASKSVIGYCILKIVIINLEKKICCTCFFIYLEMMCADVSVCGSDQVRRKNMMKKMTKGGSWSE